MQVWACHKHLFVSGNFCPKMQNLRRKIPILEKIQSKTEIVSTRIFSLRNVPAVWQTLATSCPANMFEPR